MFALVTDPVADGFVASLARPGGNVTGFTIFEHSFAGKWLEMLKEVVPTMTRVAVMQNPDHPAWKGYLHAIGEIARGMGVEVTPAPITGPADDRSRRLPRSRARPNGGLVLLPSLIGHGEPRGDRSDRAAPSLAVDLPGADLRRERWPDVLRLRR